MKTGQKETCSADLDGGTLQLKPEPIFKMGARINDDFFLKASNIHLHQFDHSHQHFWNRYSDKSQMRKMTSETKEN